VAEELQQLAICYGLAGLYTSGEAERVHWKRWLCVKVKTAIVTGNAGGGV